MDDINSALEVEKNAFEHKCYEAYKLRWMIAHGNTLQEFVDTLGEIAAESIKSNGMLAITDEENAKSFIEDAHDAFVVDVGFRGGLWACGFRGSLWACFDEFMQTEFRDPVYMMKLIELMDNYEEMWNFYCEHFLKE